MAIPVTELHDWFHTEIFNQIPLNIAVIRSDYTIVKANKNFLNYFGPWQGKKCYQVYKKSKKPCRSCEAFKTFNDGKVRIYEEEGFDAEGNPAYYVVHTAPVMSPEGEITHVIEMSQNITDVYQQRKAFNILFERTPCYIAVIDKNYKITRANEKLRETFGEVHGKHCYEVYKKKDHICNNCPAKLSFKDGQVHTSNQIGLSKDGQKTHYVVTTSPLAKGKEKSDYVLEILTDVTHLKILEKEKLDAERLAAVGQTVAGLAHSVKNILMGVEGGMYMMSMGFKRQNEKRIAEGWEILNRNIPKVSTLVKDFLSFAKGKLPEAIEADPNSLVDEIVTLYKETARGIGVELKRKRLKKIKPALLDPKGIHTCLTNLVSNAIDACQMSKGKNPVVTIDVRDENETLIFEVQDNGLGMDYDVKQKVFTTFFTTKAGKGTGLGLLTTRKIVTEHGGKITVESQKGKGSVFKIELPRKNLPKPVLEDDQ